MSSDLRVLTIDYAGGHTENSLFSTADIKQTTRILDELPCLVEHASMIPDWDIITITDSRIGCVTDIKQAALILDELPRLVEQQREEIEKLTRQLEAANLIIEDRERAITLHRIGGGNEQV